MEALFRAMSATNMTEQFAALAALFQNPGQVRDDALLDFYNKWQHDYLAVSKWFALQATSNSPGNVANVKKLLNHAAFDMRNPNKVYSLIGGFRGSAVNFHVQDGGIPHGVSILSVEASLSRSHLLSIFYSLDVSIIWV
ncbi:hypothetical protein GUJ93_ZPchr0008g13148 [Zizania palustris]|uniref:Peptidase M1 alanyl aminopeptidase C-terminal domain-containing protein n=1 Tax=Zizania palustris TaxID=103762 RepID=A0A8J5VI97_ZIZPA|nr:hypothetical protein GUJ93_ZPchr0008g13148 [Zizania palustris]